MKEGYTVEDFYKVIDAKCKEWLNDANYSKYLRPETLFGSKFEGYLNGCRLVTSKNDNYYDEINLTQQIADTTIAEITKSGKGLDDYDFD